MLDKYLQKVDEMKKEGQVGEEEYMYLRSLKEVGHIVADVSLNEDRAFTEAEVEEIRRRKNEEVQARAVKAEERAAREEELRKQAEEKRAREEERARKAEKRANRKESTVQEQTANIRRLAQSVGTAVDWAIRISLFTLLAGGVYFALPKIPPESGSDLWKVVVTFFVGVAALYGLYDAFTQARSWSKRAGKCVERKIKNSLLAPPEDEESEVQISTTSHNQ
jgi:cation transport ATPase